jgi:3-hydroxyacyl-CoA dehydrogenase
VAVHRSLRDGVLVVELDNPPVNALSPDVLVELQAALDSGVTDPAVRAFVLSGRNGIFSGGADIRWFGKAPPPGTPLLPDVIARIEASPKPVLAAIDGTAFGGGFEIALACDRRVGSPRARVALPEINLGLLPGAGGTQRLPRAVGSAAALRIILSGKPVKADEAHAAGILDSVVTGDLLAAACAQAGAMAARAGTASEITAPGSTQARLSARTVPPDPAAFASARAALAPIELGGLAAHRCVDAIEAATALPFEDGLRRERELFMELLASEQSKSRIHVFFAEREAAKVPDVPGDTPVAPVRTVCVVGAGTMGTGIAMALANGGLEVRVVEAADDVLARGRALIEKNYAASARKGRFSEAVVAERLGRMSFGTDLVVAAEADLVIEAVFEELDIKREVFARLEAICRPDAILASNTSTLDIDAIARGSSRAGDIIGLHFFSPANVMKLLEIVRGDATSARAIATSLALAKTIGKVAVVARTCDGFIANRILAPYGRETMALVEEGALPQDVDRVMERFGFPMGPFRMYDLAGLDVGWRIRKRRLAEGKLAAVRESEIGDRLCERGRYGQKTGAGIYRYDENRTPQPDPEVEALIAAESARLGITRRRITDDEILNRCVLALINESAKTLEDGTAIRPGDIDVAWIYGFGFPAYRGGPLHYADTLGLAHVRDQLIRLSESHGAHWRPAPLIERLAARGARFANLGAYEAVAEPTGAALTGAVH